MPTRPIITLTTDFGDTDYYVGAMKGVILTICPEARLVDLSHQIHSQDILGGAFLVDQVYRHFPARTTHLVVIDPGVGTARRSLIVSAGDHIFVAPDNGVLSLVYASAADVRVIHATASHYFRNDISQTFQGRDIFAPLAAWVTRGIPLDNFGETITDFVRFKLPVPAETGPNRLRGAVIKVDRFGNCVTNITPQWLPGFNSPQRPAFKFRIGTTLIHQILTAYADAEGDAPFMILGSAGYLEISTNRGSAAETLKIQRGAEIEVTW